MQQPVGGLVDVPQLARIRQVTKGAQRTASSDAGVGVSVVSERPSVPCRLLRKTLKAGSYTRPVEERQGGEALPVGQLLGEQPVARLVE